MDGGQDAGFSIPPELSFSTLIPANGVKPYGNSDFPEIGKFRPTIGIFNFFAFFWEFCSGIPLPRLVIDPPTLILSRNLPLKPQIPPVGEPVQWAHF